MHIAGSAHADNHTMQHVTEKDGFIRTGIIYAADKTPGIAYQKALKK